MISKKMNIRMTKVAIMQNEVIIMSDKTTTGREPIYNGPVKHLPKPSSPRPSDRK